MRISRADRRQERKLFDCTRLAGIEVEYVKSKDFSPIYDWTSRWRSSVHSDGSCGWEAVTAPAAGDHLVTQTRGLMRALNDAEASVNENCGIHVHVDAADLKWPDIERLMRVYARVEPLLYLIGGHKRVENRYCRPAGKDFESALGDTNDKKEALLQAIYSSDDSNAYNARRIVRRDGTEKKMAGRYKGLNLCPWVSGRHRGRAKHGKSKARHGITSDTTIEFRIHRESLDADRVLNWAKLCVRIVDWIAKASDAEAAALPANSARALCVIAPDLTPWIIQRIRAWREATSRRSRRVHYSPRKGYTIGKAA